MKPSNATITSSQILSPVAKRIMLRATDPCLPTLPAGAVYLSTGRSDGPRMYATASAEAGAFMHAHRDESVGIFQRLDWKWISLIVVAPGGHVDDSYRFLRADLTTIEPTTITVPSWAANPRPHPQQMEQQP